MPDSNKKSAAELLRELRRVRAILEANNPDGSKEDIPLLKEVVPARKSAPPAAASAPPPPGPAPEPAPEPVAEPAAELPSEQELEAMVDRIINQEMPRIRLELKRVLRDELRLRGLLK